MKAKLIKESLNESISGHQVLDNIAAEQEAPSVVDIAEYIIDNWTRITGEPESEMYQEQEFHDVVLEILDIVGIDYDEFSQVWGEALEGREEVNLGRYNEDLNETGDELIENWQMEERDAVKFEGARIKSIKWSTFGIGAWEVRTDKGIFWIDSEARFIGNKK